MGRRKGSKNKAKSVGIDESVRTIAEIKEEVGIPYAKVVYETEFSRDPETPKTKEPTKWQWFVLGMLWAGLIAFAIVFIR